MVSSKWTLVVSYLWVIEESDFLFLLDRPAIQVRIDA